MKSKIIAILCCTAGLLSPVWCGPVLKVEPPSFKFGTYPANEEKEHAFTLTNAGDADLKIDKVRTTCGCSAAEVARKELKPGESTTLTAKIKKESIAGPFSKAVFIHSNAVNGAVQMITVSGESAPLLTVAPQDKLYAGTLTVGTPFRQEFLLKASQPVTLDAPAVFGDIRPEVEVEAMPENRYKVVVSWMPDRELAAFQCTVSFVIRSPENWNPVKITLQGQVKR